ncbi:hypothetical protein QBC37DRAFT_463162 [Rhypophila decipiens]|uniref:LOV domain-containing protein n=1 Tax=Rhypophila decipiens TaxID=261697 RepID=A0AAN6YC02_9PEZI|nr:hypothetical protein QBC37DRAFT_463162 [Rhypophila decipiens]
MFSVKRNTYESISNLSDDWSRRGSTQSTSTLILPYRMSARGSDLNLTALSPPPVPPGDPRTKPVKTHSPFRLRSDSGLALHTNKNAFRQYTDYNSDGSLRTPSIKKKPFSFESSSGSDSITVGTSVHINLGHSSHQVKPVPQFFDSNVIKAVFADSATKQRLLQFAQGTASAADVEFLLKVDEYTHALGNMTGLIAKISEDFTISTARTPLDIPCHVSNNVRANTKTCARLAIPQLERLYRDTRVSVEERLAKTLYPDFLKYQLAQCMRSSLSVSRSLTGGFQSAYPGLGDAFCLTDALRPDNPIAYVSDGLLKMTGYKRRDIVDQNCSILQGFSTDPEAARRIREAVLFGQETTELILNHRRDGTPFWNLLFICPLFEKGTVRYYLGGQINVSESMGTECKDILRILNFRIPGEEFPYSSVGEPAEQPISRSRSNLKEKLETASDTDDNQGSRQKPGRHRFFRRLSKKSKVGRPHIQTVPHADEEEDWPLPTRRLCSPRMPQVEQQYQHISPLSTPYSRFLVLRYVPAPTTFPLNSSTSPHVHLRVAFCSPSALELLGLKPANNDMTRITSHTSCSSTQGSDAAALEPILNADIFTVLSEHANSPSINKGFRFTVLKKVTCGEAISIDLLTSIGVSTPLQSSSSSLSSTTSTQPDQPGQTTATAAPPGTRTTAMVNKNKHARSASLIRSAVAMIKKGHGGAIDRNFQPSPGHNNDGQQQQVRQPRLSETLERGAEILSNVFFGPKMNKLVSHWSPLKDEKGKVGYVVLVLTAAIPS